jgi:ribonuclease R
MNSKYCKPSENPIQSTRMNKDKKPGLKKSSQVNLLRGRLDISKSGMGFVIVEDLDKDILIRPNDFGKAFHGDIVRVQIATGGSVAKRA